MPATLSRAAITATITAALALTLALPSTALALVDGLKETSDTTYTLLPDEGKVHVEGTITLVNQKKPTTGRGPCKNRPSKTCKTRTTYYVDGWSSAWVPADAEDVRVTGKGVTTTELGADASGTFHTFDFPRLKYRKKLKINLSYDLPGGEPGSAHATRITDGYAHFCWTGELSDSGITRAFVPEGWDVVTSPARTSRESGPVGTVILARSRKSPFDFYACTDAFKTDSQQRIYVLGPSEQVITLDNWPSDPEWQQAMLDVIGGDLPALEEIVGSAMPFAALTINEVARTNPYDMRTDFSPADARLFIDEDVDAIGVPTIALARTWFNESTIQQPWLEQGLTMWAGLSAVGSACPDPGEIPGNSDPVLAEWAEREGKPMTWDGDRLYYQTAAACGIVEQLAVAIGPERMADVISAVLAGTPRYGPQPADARPTTEPADWHDFLDAVDELGLIPAGETDFELAEQLMYQFGVATLGDLNGRASARQIYHDELTEMDGTQMPAHVNRLMEQWSFSEALLAVVEAGNAYRTITADPDLSTAERTALLGAFEAADSPEALVALVQLIATTS